MKSKSIKVDAFTKKSFENLRDLISSIKARETELQLKIKLLDVAHDAVWGLVYSKHKNVNPKKLYSYNYDEGTVQEREPKKTDKKKGKK